MAPGPSVGVATIQGPSALLRRLLLGFEDSGSSGLGAYRVVGFVSRIKQGLGFGAFGASASAAESSKRPFRLGSGCGRVENSAPF